jgi:hypothetical protein
MSRSCRYAGPVAGARSVNGTAGPPGRRTASFLGAWAPVIGGLRDRGWIWLLSMLWVGAGVAITGYFFYVTTRPFGWADVTTGIYGWSADPVAVRITVVLALVAWLALPLPVLIAGFIRLRGWRPASWLRAAAWAGAWIAGASLMALASAWGHYPEGSCPHSYQNGMVCPVPSPAVVSWGELVICPAWLVLGAVMTQVLRGRGKRPDHQGWGAGLMG